jgi:hypothetical protein
MPRIAGLKPFTKADEETQESSAIVESGWHSETDEDFASRPPTDQIKRRLSGVEDPKAKKAPAWINLTVSIKPKLIGSSLIVAP